VFSKISDIFTKWLEFDTKLRMWHKDLKNVHYKAILGVAYVVVNVLLFASFIGVLTFLFVMPFLLLTQVLLMIGLSSGTVEIVVCITLGFVVAYLIALERNV